jgi:hypothetical protein
MTTFCADVPVVPIRSEPRDAAEMVTQLLAGELAELIESGEKDWVRVRCVHDDYEGWCDRKMLANCAPNPSYRLFERQWEGVRASDGARVFFSMGTSFAVQNGEVQIGGRSYHGTMPSSHSADQLVELAKLWLGTPYLWGGRSIWGVDCSGLVQVLHELAGLELPRDASDQFDVARPVEWSDRKPGDLAFFANPEGRIVHVGILSGDNEILHAAGEVRIDNLTADGIVHALSSRQTHKLAGLGRVS